MVPPPMTSQPSDAEPSPPTLSLPMKLRPLQTDGCHSCLAVPFMPFCAASVMAWVHDVPAVIAMNTSGFLAASVVISLVMFGAVGSIVSNSKSMSCFDCAMKALKPAS